MTYAFRCRERDRDPPPPPRNKDSINLSSMVGDHTKLFLLKTTRNKGWAWAVTPTTHVQCPVETTTATEKKTFKSYFRDSFAVFHAPGIDETVHMIAGTPSSFYSGKAHTIQHLTNDFQRVTRPTELDRRGHEDYRQFPDPYRSVPPPQANCTTTGWSATALMNWP